MKPSSGQRHLGREGAVGVSSPFSQLCSSSSLHRSLICARKGRSVQHCALKASRRVKEYEVMLGGGSRARKQRFREVYKVANVELKRSKLAA